MKKNNLIDVFFYISLIGLAFSFYGCQTTSMYPDDSVQNHTKDDIQDKTCASNFGVYKDGNNYYLLIQLPVKKQEKIDRGDQFRKDFSRGGIKDLYLINQSSKIIDLNIIQLEKGKGINLSDQYYNTLSEEFLEQVFLENLVEVKPFDRLHNVWVIKDAK